MATPRLNLPLPALTDLVEQGQANISALSTTLDNAVLVFGTSDVLPPSNNYAIGSILLHQLTGAPPIVYISTSFGWEQLSATSTQPVSPGGILTGTVLDFAGSAAPAGYVLCDGLSYSTTGATAALFSVIGTTYGGSGAAFNVPDCRSRTTVGAGPGPGLSNRALGAKSGVESVALSTAEMPSHGHTIGASGTGIVVTDRGHTHPFGGRTPFTVVGDWGQGWAAASNVGGPAVPAAINNGWPASTGGTALGQAEPVVADPGHAHSMVSTGGGTAHENLQPSIVFNKIIKL